MAGDIVSISALVNFSIPLYMYCLCCSGCIQLLDTLPETVYRVCDLIVVVAGRNGDNWKSDMLTSLMSGVSI